jgi:hypothetical protein
MMKHLTTVNKAVIPASIAGVGLAIAITGCGFLLGRWLYAAPNLALEQSASGEAVARSAPAAVGTLAVAPTIEETTGTIPLIAPLAGSAIAQAPPSAAPRTCHNGLPQSERHGDRPGGRDTTGRPGFGFQHFKSYDFLNDYEVLLTFDDGPWLGHSGLFDTEQCPPSFQKEVQGR